MTTEDDSASQLMRGRVKWFDPGKGYGFVVADDGGADILLHANVLRNFGQNSVLDGSGIEIEVLVTGRGRQAVSILSIEPPDMPSSPPLGDFVGLDPTELAALPLVPARIKWFDKAKGFGFANVYGNSEDVFVHIEVLRRSGLSDLQPGEAVAMRVIDGKRGKMACEVTAWDTAQGS